MAFEIWVGFWDEKMEEEENKMKILIIYLLNCITSYL